jgi:hypothetical protein
MSASCRVFVRIMYGAGRKKGNKEDEAWWLDRLREQGYSIENVRADMQDVTVWPNGHGSKNVYDTYGKLTAKVLAELLG